MVKQSPFQQDLFDFKYIEDQVSAIKANMETDDQAKQETENLENPAAEKQEASESNQELDHLLNEQLHLLNEINNKLNLLLEEPARKKGFFNFRN